MNKTGTLISALALSLIFLSVSSCKKVRENKLISGLWKLDDIYVDTISKNQLENLPHFTDGNNCCNYRLDFQDGDVVFGYYLTYDTFNFVTTGTWPLTDY